MVKTRKNGKNRKDNETQCTTIKLRRSERIRNALLKKQGKSVPKIDLHLSIPSSRVDNKTIKNKSTKASIKATLSKTVSKNTKDEDISKIKEKYYTEIARDETYRDKISLNPIAYNKDKYGNLAGNEYDLAMDHAFGGFLISVLQLYNEHSFDFVNPKTALEQKGFKVHRWTTLPKIEVFKNILNRSCQFWIISTSRAELTEEHINAVEEFFNSGRGVYIWGDNDPYNADANKLAEKLMNANLSGNYSGGKVVNIQVEENTSGLVPSHLINTGLDYLFEGITIASVKQNDDLETVMRDSESNVVIASYNKDGKRAIIDGGFTRLYHNWDTAGTGRYVKNAAAWLANIENIPIN